MKPKELTRLREILGKLNGFTKRISKKTYWKYTVTDDNLICHTWRLRSYKSSEVRDILKYRKHYSELYPEREEVWNFWLPSGIMTIYREISPISEIAECSFGIFQKWCEYLYELDDDIYFDLGIKNLHDLYWSRERADYALIEYISNVLRCKKSSPHTSQKYEIFERIGINLENDPFFEPAYRDMVIVIMVEDIYVYYLDIDDYYREGGIRDEDIMISEVTEFLMHYIMT